MTGVGSDERPLRVYGPEASYFTGKLEAYLRYKGIAYQRIGERSGPAAVKHTGRMQVPAVLLPDGRWATDTTPLIAWLETLHPEPAVIPTDPLQRFFALLVEDFGDEWLWRPAMHYRWSYPTTALHLSRRISEDMLGHVPLPGFARRWLVRRRQRGLFVTGDGVDRATWSHVENCYHRTLAWMTTVLAERPFLLGARPSIADYGLFGSMFRHFGMDPTPASIMRDTAPDVYAWVARVWAARADRENGPFEAGIPDSWGPGIAAIGSGHLVQLVANARAFEAGRTRFDVEIEGVPYRRLRTSRYRVWCLEELQRRYRELPEPAAREARALLERHGAWEPLFAVTGPNSAVDPEGRAPFIPAVSMTGLRRRS